MFRERRHKVSAEIPGSSLADIAFLLLIFFLVATSFNTDSGIGLVLPPPSKPNQPPPEINERNLLNILVNAQGLVSIDGTLTPMNQVENKVRAFITNRGQDPNMSDSPTAAVISIKTARETTYSIYIDMLDKVIGAYKDVRNTVSIQKYGKPFSALIKGSEAQETIEDLIPRQISIAEPEGN